MGLDPAAPLQAVQSRVEGALLHLQRFARDLLQAFGDGPAVKRFQSKGFEDKEIECALGQLQPFVSNARSTLPLLHRTIEHADVEVQGERERAVMRRSTLEAAPVAESLRG